jgi:nitroimidazol reductase NimA-like FMN-containing flavoprotein (pyridoxamine 5'-phosphate oxidase superfamily)
MRARKPESQLEEIPAEECWELLGQHEMGRIAIVVGGKPQIFPVNYGLKGKVIVFRTAVGSKLAYAPESPVAFEVEPVRATQR